MPYRLNIRERMITLGRSRRALGRSVSTRESRALERSSHSGGCNTREAWCLEGCNTQEITKLRKASTRKLSAQDNYKILRTVKHSRKVDTQARQVLRRVRCSGYLGGTGILIKKS